MSLLIFFYWNIKIDDLFIKYLFLLFFSFRWQITHSDATTVTLRSVTRDLTGQFQCEVSEDAPLFHTDIRASRMQVVELPNEEPRLNVEKKSISSNDNLRATCTVGTSFPAANMTWYINGKKVSFRFIRWFAQKKVDLIFFPRMYIEKLPIKVQISKKLSLFLSPSLSQ